MADISVYDSAETEAERIARYHAFIQRYDQTGYNLTRTSEDQYVLTNEAARATVNFWDDIIELNVVNIAKDEEVFALHFQLRDDAWEHGEQLFGEMVQALRGQTSRKTVDILLTCSSAMTTTLFAQKLNQVAKTLSLDYSFRAAPVRDIYRVGQNYDVVLMAPQVSFMYENVRSALRGTVVVEIPPRLFGSYDSAGTIALVRESLEQARRSREEYAVHKIMHGDDTNACVLSIVVKQTSEIVEIGWRVYDQGEMQREGVTIKQQPIHAGLTETSPGATGIVKAGIELSDFTDIIDTVVATADFATRIEAIAVAVVGSVEGGTVHLANTKIDHVNIEKEITRRYGKPCVVSNNVNSAALGWYSQQDKYQTVVFHSQSYGLAIGGQGIVVNGELHTGLHSFAGELQNFYPAIGMKNLFPAPGYVARLYDPAELVELLAKVFSVDIGILAPEVICLRCRSTPDMEVIRQALDRYVPREDQPELIYIPHFTDYIYIGLYVMAVRKLRNL